MEEPKIIAEPTAEMKKRARNWQKEEQERKQKRKKVIAIKQYEKERVGRIEKMKERKTNQEIADMPEFQDWCKNQNIKPTKRQVSKHREEFETYLSSLKEDAQFKKAV